MKVWTMESDIGDLIEDCRNTVLPVAAERMEREDAMATARPEGRPWTPVSSLTPAEKLAASPGVSDVLAHFGKTAGDAVRDRRFQEMAASQAARAARRRVVNSVTEFVARPEVIAALKAAGMSEQAIRAALESGELERWLFRRGAL